MNQHYRIDAPIPVTLRPTDKGVDVDISMFLIRAVFVELFQQAAEDPEGFGEEFADMHQLALSAQHQGRDSHARHEFDARMEKLLEQYAGDGRIEVYGNGLRQMRDATAELTAPRPVPAQREAGAA